MKYPKEIRDFLYQVFEIYDIRGYVGNCNGIKFEIRTKETNHALPHVHAEYAEFNISIEIATGKILAGNLPRKNEKMAVDWVLANKEKLLNEWSNIAISATSNLTKTRLNRRFI